ncbi:MAG: ImmA/IrrE family metallo-endopeptidase, partial [Dehalococcoidia bacterium]|nr:ImmA/IrrE family metallo-endopeptidase [Dehalococcoidia bacterium]
VKLMWINALLSSAEQRLVIAHELGHWINGDEQVIRTCRSSSFAYHWDARLERDATIAAARLLIPEWAVREYGTVEAIAAACDVPAWLVQVGYRTE